jgi:hypothetical protein
MGPPIVSQLTVAVAELDERDGVGHDHARRVGDDVLVRLRAGVAGEARSEDTLAGQHPRHGGTTPVSVTLTGLNPTTLY